MAFPTTPLDTKVELNLAGTWTDITAYTYVRDPIRITRGRADEAPSMDPSSCELTVNNRDGRFSPRNPAGPYYGSIGRNAPVRVSARLGGVRLVTAAPLDWVSTPDSAGLSIVGDIDLRVDARVETLAASAIGSTLINKSRTAGQRSYRMGLQSDCRVFIIWSADGTNELLMASTVAVPRTSGRLAIRATLDVDNGAAGRTATFYYSDSISATWTQLGAAVVEAGTTSIFDGSGALFVGSTTTTSPGYVVYAAQVYQGIAGTVRANPDFTAQADGATSFADAAGNTWTIGGTASLTNRRYRFHGEVSSWPARWDLSGRDVWTPVVAAGVLRRSGQGAAPLAGPIQREALTDATLRAYWPMEDEAGAASMASGLSGGPAMSIGGTPDLASSDLFAVSGPLPALTFGSFAGAVNSYTSTGTIHARCLMGNPAAGDTNNGVIMRIYTTGTAARWDYLYNTGGGLTLSCYDSAGVLINAEAVGFTNNGKSLVLVVELVQNGANIDTKMLTMDVAAGGGLLWPKTINSRTVGAATSIEINPGGLLDGTVVGHVAVASAIPASSAEQALRGYLGETAGRRVERLCAEEGVTFTGYGDLDDSTLMGVQRPAQLLTLLAECPTADLGAIVEPRDSFGLGYRVRTSMYGQVAGLPLDYGNLRDLAPVEDDQATRNDVTVTRPFGSSARQELTTGALSTQAPPSGVGRYDESTQISISTDAALPDQASWRLHMGTVDEARYPVIGLILEAPAFAASSALTSSALDLDVGDLLTISNPPAWLPPDQIRQIAQGFTETLLPFKWELEVNCTPASPWDTGLYDDPSSPTTRYSADGATLSAGITSTATGAAALAIVTPAGKPLWTSDPADFPLDIVMGGERIALSAIAATASPQAATVSARSVNGVVKAHLAGAALDVADPDYYAL